MAKIVIEIPGPIEQEKLDALVSYLKSHFGLMNVEVEIKDSILDEENES